jgi:hypothetical protein
VETGQPQLASETFTGPIQHEGHLLEVPILHQAYFSGFDKKNKHELLAWMMETFKMPHRPRLAATKGDSLVLSPELKFIAENFDSSHFLNLLRYHHRAYSLLLQDDLDGFQEKLWEEIASTLIRYPDPTDTAQQRLIPIALREAVLPSIDTLKLQAQVPLPLLPIAGKRYMRLEWMFLQWFKVKLEPDYTHWLACLKKVKSDPVNGKPLGKSDSTRTLERERASMISTIYSKLHDACQLAQYQPRIVNEIR